jgi:hypothetical protein
MTQTDRLSLSRRGFLTGSAAAGLIAGAAPLPVLAKAPMRHTQAPAFYRFKIGSFEATVVSDGPLNLGEPKPETFPGLSKEELDKALDDNFLPQDRLLVEQNALIVNTGNKLVLSTPGWAAPRCSATRPADCWPL